ncbi:MAG: RHS repeat-associated core domain-containing protein [Actinomycetota bacterium]
MLPVTDPKGQVTDYDYDALDRVTQLKFQGGSSIVNVYDDGGRLTRTDNKAGPGPLDPVETVTYGYDRLNRQTTKSVGGVTFTSVFDGVGNLLSITDTGVTPVTVNYEYDGANRLSALVEPGGARTTFGYDLAYRRNLITYPNGVTQSTVYDDDGKVTSIEGKKGTTVLTNFAYDYRKPTGEPTSLVYKMTDSSGDTIYKYDQMERLTEAATPGGIFNYSFDGNGNRLRSSINGAAETFYAVNAADQLCHTASAQAACGSAPAGAQTYQYDSNGNLSGQSDGRVLTYNSKDQTTSFKPGGLLAQTTNMTYLGTGQSERTTAGGSTFKNGPLGLAIHSSGLLSTTNYVRTPEGDLVSLRNGLTAYYYLFDRLGTVVALTDASGNAVNRYFYDPYGNYLVGTTEAVANPWQYAGGFKDAFSGYYKFGARYYDPVIGRWTQPDPSGQDANSYVYAGSNPANFVDPSGLDWIDWLKDHTKILIPTWRRTANGRIVKIRIHVVDRHGGGPTHMNIDFEQIGGTNFHFYYRNFFPNIGKAVASVSKLNPALYIPIPGSLVCESTPSRCEKADDYSA